MKKVERRQTNMKQKQILGIAALSMVAILSLSMVSAFGFGKGFGVMNSEITDEDHTEILAQREGLRIAIENNDFESWKVFREELMTKIQSRLTEERFNEIVTLHQERTEFRDTLKEARESGNLERMQELKAEFGLGKQFHRMNMNFGNCLFAK